MVCNGYTKFWGIDFPLSWMTFLLKMEGVRRPVASKFSKNLVILVVKDKKTDKLH